MHDTAFEAAEAFFRIHFRPEFSRVLEIGSFDVGGYWSPGKLRDLAPKGVSFVGVDMASGDNVDIVIDTAESLPFPDGSFDVVMSSSAFEHDPAFWVTFLEMGRVIREGGFIYINAPSNGSFHRYPDDNWRFYPDAGVALERWAARNDQPIRLVESFIAERKRDIWNDFCAVFMKVRGEMPAFEQFISDVIPSTNIRKCIHGEIEAMRAETEDMILARARYVEAGAADEKPPVAQVDVPEALPADPIARLRALNQRLSGLMSNM